MNNPQSRPPIEPRAELRVFARAMREMYVALLAEDFAVAEAMNIIGVTIAAGIANGKA